jgi:hypothetical protein
MKRDSKLYEEARRLRRDEQFSLDEIVSRLSARRTTVFGWIRDIPLSIVPDRRAHALLASKAMSAKYKQKREAAYENAARLVPGWMRDKRFRDFVVLYMAEGSRRTRYRLAIANTDPDIIRIGYEYLRKFSQKTFHFYLLCHREVDRKESLKFWADIL